MIYIHVLDFTWEIKGAMAQIRYPVLCHLNLTSKCLDTTDMEHIGFDNWIQILLILAAVYLKCHWGEGSWFLHKHTKLGSWISLKKKSFQGTRYYEVPKIELRYNIGMNVVRHWPEPRTTQNVKPKSGLVHGLHNTICKTTKCFT